MKRWQRTSAQEWREIVGGQHSSGLSVAGYCRQRRISEASFYAWKRRLRSSGTGFVEVKRANALMSGALEMILPGERRLVVRPGFDRDLLIELLRVLENLS